MSRQGGWEPPPEGKLPASVERPNRTIKFGAAPPDSAAADGAGGGSASDPGAAYRLGARLGQSGEVYEAQTPRFQGRLAMKLYRRAAGLGQAPLEAFARDAARASTLRHPHIAHVLETGTLRDGTPFVTTEYLTGQTLEEQLAGRGAFLPAELLPTIRGVASALSAAHAAGLVHRELRPDNVFLAVLDGYESGFVKLLDFGACHLTAAQRAAGRELGPRATRCFAPEQLGGGRVEDIDARADQFALAAITYRMLSGAEPAAAGAGTAQAAAGTQAHAGGAFATPLARRAPSVDAVLSKALSRVAQDRFASVSLFLQALEEALAGAAMIVTPGPARVAPNTSAVDPGVAAGRDDQPPSGGDLEDYGRAPPPARREGDFTGEEPRQARGGITSVANVRQLPDSHPTVGERRGAGPRRDPFREPFAREPLDRPSLTQQFFAEGERQEATSYKNAPPDPGDISASLQFESFDRVPKRRKPLVAAVLVTLIGLGGLAWYAGFRPPQSWRESSWWRQLRLPDGVSAPGTAPEPPSAGGIAAPPAPAEATTSPAPAPLAQPQALQPASQPQTDAGTAAAAIAALDGAAPPDATSGGATPPGSVSAPGADGAPTTHTTEGAAPAAPLTAQEQRAASVVPDPRPAPRRRKTPGEATSTGPAAKRGAASERSEPWPSSADPPRPPPLPPPESRPGPPPFNPDGTAR